MAISVTQSPERNYKKLPLSKDYYDLKDKGNHTASKKIAKKTLASASTPASSSSSSLNLSSSISSSSSSSSQSSVSSVSKVSKSILSKELESGLEAVKPPQGKQTSSQLSSSQINVKDNEEVESDRASTQQLDLHWLKKEQRALLLTLPKEYALDNEIRLYDLLGFHLHTLLEKLKKSIPSVELQEKFDSAVIKEFHQRYLLLYISLRARNKDTTTVRMFHTLRYDNLDKRCFVKRADIPSYFSVIEESLNAVIPNIKIKMGAFKQENSTQMQLKLKAKLFEKDLKLIESQLADIHSSLKLLQAFLINDDRSHSLLSSLLNLPGSESMNKDPRATRDCLIKWIQFINQASLDLSETGDFFHFGKFISGEPLKHLPNLVTSNLKIEPKKHLALHNWYKETLVAIQQDFLAQKYDVLTEVIDKHLSYEEYCKLEGLTPRKPFQTNQQVISMLFQTCNHGDLFCMLGYDFLRIMETNIISPLIKGNYISSSEWMTEILGNIGNLGNLSSSTLDYEKELTSIPFSKHPGIKRFNKHLQQSLTQLMTALKEAFSQKSIQSAIQDTIELVEGNHKNPVLIYILLTNLLSTLKPVFATQQPLLFKLQEIRQTSLSKLKSKQELSLQDQHEISARFYEAMIPFFPYIWLMNDAQILSDGRELEITMDKRHLPKDLESLITFDTEDFPHVQQQPREKAPDDTPLQPKPQTNPASTLTRKEARELEKLSFREEPRQRAVESPEDLRLINKRTDLLSYLKRAGYLPTDSKRGSHTVLKTTTGKTTVVPKGKQDRIAKGTLRAIKRQVQPGKESETTVILGRAPKAKKKSRRKKVTKTDTTN